MRLLALNDPAAPRVDEIVSVPNGMTLSFPTVPIKRLVGVSHHLPGDEFRDILMEPRMQCQCLYGRCCWQNLSSVGGLFLNGLIVPSRFSFHFFASRDAPQESSLQADGLAPHRRSGVA